MDVESVRLPGGEVIDDFYVVKLPDYVVVLALTKTNDVAAVRQYKHSLGRVILTLPAGYVEEGEDALACARRELLEETGFVAGDWRALGSFVVDGNRGCGRAYLFLANGARICQVPAERDVLEEVEVRLMRRQELRAAILHGQIPLLASVAAIGIALSTHNLEL